MISLSSSKALWVAAGAALILHLGLLLLPLMDWFKRMDSWPQVLPPPLVVDLVAAPRPPAPRPPDSPAPSRPESPPSEIEPPQESEPEDSLREDSLVEDSSSLERPQFSEALPSDLIFFRQPRYPQLARQRGWEGVVVVRFFVSREGLTQSHQILHSSGYPVLDRSAVQAIRLWRFKPDSSASGRWLDQAIRFSLVEGKSPQSYEGDEEGS